MKTRDMALLVRVAEAGSMTRAAAQLHLTPAAVSAALKRVEADLGVRVFERTTRALSPTAEGEVVLAGCRDVLSRWARALDEVRGEARAIEGTVHVSAPVDTTYQVLAPALVALSDAHPCLRVVVHSSDALHRLHREDLDMAIRYGPLPDSGLFARKLAQAPHILVAAPHYLARHGHPQHPADLAAHRCITLQQRGALTTAWTLSGPDGAHTHGLGGALCGDGLLARRWACDGAGIALKSAFDVVDDLEQGRLVHVLPTYTGGHAAIHAVFRGRALPLRVRTVEHALTAVFRTRAARCATWLNMP